MVMMVVVTTHGEAVVGVRVRLAIGTVHAHVHHHHPRGGVALTFPAQTASYSVTNEKSPTTLEDRIITQLGP